MARSPRRPTNEPEGEGNAAVEDRRNARAQHRVVSLAPPPQRVDERGLHEEATKLAAARIDAVNLRQHEWTAGLTTLFHRFGVLAFGWDAQHERQIAALIDMGIDAVYGDYVDRLVAVAGTFEDAD